MRLTWLKQLLRRPQGIFGTLVIVALIVVAVTAIFWTPRDPFDADPFHQWAAPSAKHPFGTDQSGQDILSYLMAGAKTTVLVAFFSSLVASIVGIFLAVLGSVTGRWIREPIAVLIDILIAFPVLLIAIMLSAVFGGSLTVVVVAVGIGFGVQIGRVSRGEIRKVFGTDFVLAARASGVGPWRNLFSHILPNIAPVFIVQLSLGAGVAVLSEAGLSFLGYGASPDTASWGRLLSEMQDYVTIYPWSALWPGAAITLTVLGFNLFGDALREATDPRLKSGRRIRRRERIIQDRSRHARKHA